MEIPAMFFSRFKKSKGTFATFLKQPRNKPSFLCGRLQPTAARMTKRGHGGRLSASLECERFGMSVSVTVRAVANRVAHAQVVAMFNAWFTI